MHRIVARVIAVSLAVAPLYSASAQTVTNPSKVRLTIERLNEMRAKWSANKPKLKACRQDVKAKGLTGVDPQTGSRLWEYTDGAGTMASSVAAKDTIYAVSHGVTALQPQATAPPRSTSARRGLAVQARKPVPPRPPARRSRFPAAGPPGRFR